MCEKYLNWLSLAFHQPGAWPATQACALTGNQTGDLLVHRLVLNPLSHTSQGSGFRKHSKNQIFSLYQGNIRV